MPLDIQSNRQAQKYSRKELFLRILWGFGKLVFRLSPRPCVGLRRAVQSCLNPIKGHNFFRI